MKLRDYQVAALDTIWEDLKTEQNVLLRAITGSGKTCMMVKLVERVIKEKTGNVLILVHKRELIEQFLGSFETFTKVPQNIIGVCCAGLKSKIISKRITIATIQSFYRQRQKYGGASLIVIDEAHVIPYHDRNSRYRQVIDTLRSKEPQSRILGCTSTPARLGHGYIFGKRCKPGEQNLFPRENFAVGYERLKDAGHLVPLRGKVASHESISEDLSGVSINGDYVLSQLGEIMAKEQHVNTVATAIDEYCQDYKCIVVFCCTIDHAIKVHQAIPESTIVHSQLTDLERQGNMDSWKSGRTRIMVSVNVLIEGFDLPRLDCLVMARPTLSSTLFLQAVGRVLRTYDGKDHGFLLDLTDNVNRFGTDLDNVKVTIPKAAEKIEKKEKELIKLCPSCESEVSIYLRVCECGYEWPIQEIIEATTVPDLIDVTFKKPDPEWYEVNSMTTSIHKSRKSGKNLGRIDIEYGVACKIISAWFCLPDYYSGYAVEQAKKRWKDFSDFPFPEDVFEFESSCFIVPKRIAMDVSQKYPELVEIERGNIEMFKNTLDEEIPF